MPAMALPDRVAAREAEAELEADADVVGMDSVVVVGIDDVALCAVDADGVARGVPGYMVVE